MRVTTVVVRSLRRLSFPALGLLLESGFLAAWTAPPSESPKRVTAAASSRPVRSKTWKIRNAMSAGPISIARDATILDLPAGETGEPAVLRKGRGDWTCFPDDPATPANDPMCLDRIAMEWGKAWRAHQEPKLSASGLGYMLQGGGSASNSDPFATRPKPGETWMKEPPHMMIFPIGRFDRNVYAADERSGKPWIMFAGTPYEHLMVPVK